MKLSDELMMNKYYRLANQTGKTRTFQRDRNSIVSNRQFFKEL